MQSISTNLLTAATLSLQALAQLPRECFFATELHGISSQDEDAVLLSDLPLLMENYEHGQRLAAITANQDMGMNNHLTGL